MSDKFLSGKKILFIGPKFNDYDKHIIEELKKFGAYVDFFGEKKQGVLVDFLKKFKVFKFLYKYIQNNYLKKILKKISNDYDYLFVVRGEIITTKFLELLIEKVNFKLKFMYQWDSLETIPSVIETIKYYDQVYSFDYNDCYTYGFNYLPLFFTKDFIKKEKIQKLYDFSFVGIYHSQRHRYIIKLKEFAKKNNLTFNINLRMTWYRYLFMKLFDKSFKNISLKDVVFRNLPLTEVSRIFMQSRVVLDIVNNRQTGLTMRTFEALACGSKLLTNNQYIKKERFYNSNNICMFEDLNVNFVKSLKIEEIEQFKDYYISEWVKKIFKGNNY